MIPNLKSRLIKSMLAIGVSVMCVPVFSQEMTLCSDFEKVYFSCHAERKVISVCAAGNVSPVTGYVRFRFGDDMGNIEMEYPEGIHPPKEYFSVTNINEGNNHATHLRFKSGMYDYVISDSSSSGLYVSEGKKMVLHLTCERGDYSSINRRVFRGIPLVSPDELDY